MREFFLKICLFNIIPFAFFCFLEIFIATNKENLLSEKNLESVFKENSESFQWINYVKSDSIVILAGSSSVRYGLSCSILNRLSDHNKAFVNIALDASDPIEAYFIVKSIKNENVTSIYYGLDPIIYTKKYYMYRPQTLYLDFDFTEIINFTFQHDSRALFKRYSELLEFSICRSNDSPSVAIDVIVPEDFGSVALEQTPNNFNESVSSFFQIHRYGWSDLEFEYLKKLSELCSERNIQFAVFIPPKRSDFYRDYYLNLNDVHSEYVYKLNELDLRMPIFGKFNQLSEETENEFFLEAYHLNKKGQAKYSEIFYKMIMNDKEFFSPDYDWFYQISK